MLKAINLSKSYNGTLALDSAKGAGKTTTISLFLNFIPPSSGTAKITGLENLEYFTSLAGECYSRQQLLDLLKEAGALLLDGTRASIMTHGRMVASRTEEIGHADLERIYLEHMHDDSPQRPSNTFYFTHCIDSHFRPVSPAGCARISIAGSSCRSYSGVSAPGAGGTTGGAVGRVDGAVGYASSGCRFRGNLEPHRGAVTA
jgi:hypothetical protein